MGSPMTAAAQVRPQEATTARLNDRVVSVQQVHRRWTAADYVLGAPGEEYEPVVLTVTTPVSLSLEDTAAALFSWDYPADELADDDTVRALVAETVLNRGCGDIEEQRCRLGETTLSLHDAAYLSYCRQRAAAVFGPSTPRPVNGHALSCPRPGAAPDALVHPATAVGGR